MWTLEGTAAQFKWLNFVSVSAGCSSPLIQTSHSSVYWAWLSRITPDGANGKTQLPTLVQPRASLLLGLVCALQQFPGPQLTSSAHPIQLTETECVQVYLTFQLPARQCVGQENAPFSMLTLSSVTLCQATPLQTSSLMAVQHCWSFGRVLPVPAQSDHLIWMYPL